MPCCECRTWRGSLPSTGLRRSSIDSTGWPPSRARWAPICAGAGARLRFDRVKRAQVQNIRPGEPSAFAELLAVTYEEAEPPSGYITLYFAGGGAVRLEVECIEGELVRPWRGLENRYKASARRRRRGGCRPLRRKSPKIQIRTASLTKFLRSSDPDFTHRFEALVQARRDQPADVQEAVRSIIEEVKGRGDEALIALTNRFDHVDLQQDRSCCSPGRA